MATVQDCIELIYEETPRWEGAALTAPTRIDTVKRYFPVAEGQIAPAPQFIDRMDELRGYEGAPEQLIDTYQPAGVLKMRGYVDDLIFLLGLAGFVGAYTAGDGTITDPDGGVIPVGAGRWVFTKRGGATAKSAQLTACYSDEGVWLRGQGYGINKLDLSASGDIAATLMGLFFQRLTVDPNISPVYPSAGIPPLRKGDLTLTGLTGTGNVNDFSLSIANPLVTRRSMTVPSYFPDKLENDKTKCRLTGSIPKSTLTTADIDAITNGTSFSVEAKWVVPKVIGATTYKYSVFIQMPKCQIVTGDFDGVANQRQYNSNHNFVAAQDESLGYDAKITVVGSVTQVAAVVGN